MCGGSESRAISIRGRSISKRRPAISFISSDKSEGPARSVPEKRAIMRCGASWFRQIRYRTKNWNCGSPGISRLDTGHLQCETNGPLDTDCSRFEYTTECHFDSTTRSCRRSIALPVVQNQGISGQFVVSTHRSEVRCRDSKLFGTEDALSSSQCRRLRVLEC